MQPRQDEVTIKIAIDHRIKSTQFDLKRTTYNMLN